MKSLLLFAIVASLSTSAIADTVPNGFDTDTSGIESAVTAATPPIGVSGANCNQSINDAAQANANTEISKLDQIIKPGAPYQSMPCLNSGISISALFGYPDLTGIIDQLKTQACQYVSNKAQTVLSPLNKQYQTGVPGVTAGGNATTNSSGSVSSSSTTKATPTYIPNVFNK